MPWKNRKRIVSMISATFILGQTMALAAWQEKTAEKPRPRRRRPRNPRGGDGAAEILSRRVGLHGDVSEIGVLS